MSVIMKKDLFLIDFYSLNTKNDNRHYLEGYEREN